MLAYPLANNIGGNMNTLQDIRRRGTWADLIEGQPQHLMMVFLMVVGAHSLLVWAPEEPKRLGLDTTGWAQLSILLAILHQIIVAAVFRLQLHRHLMTRYFGERDMKIWAMVFIPLLIVRPLTVIMTGWADTIPIGLPRPLEIGVGIVLIGAALWALHSVVFYFTIPRALGGDHFRQSYADLPLVERGAFRVTSNAMYGLVFLSLWGIALLFGSWNALVVALFQHAYIWVHMYCTERPDMDWIYGKR